MTEEQAWAQIRAWAAEEILTRKTVEEAGKKAALALKPFMHEIRQLRVDQMRFNVECSFHDPHRVWFSIRGSGYPGWYEGPEFGHLTLAACVEDATTGVESKLAERRELARTYAEMSKRFI